MNKIGIRAIVLGTTAALAVLPLYLLLEFDKPAFLWLYVPIVSIWGLILMGEDGATGDELTARDNSQS